MKRISVIGSGLAGMSAAATLAKAGFDVEIYEKNDKAGGRLNHFESKGFRFEMGPSWYWMPEVFENFYREFGKTSKDFYQLKRLDPSYRVVFSKDEHIDVPADFESLVNLFESIEKGSGAKLRKFIKHAEIKYRVGMDDFVWKPGQSLTEFMSYEVVKNAFRLQLFRSIASEVKKTVRDERLRQILEFPVLFLGATAENTPALYSLMNYADLKLGTWYPMGGMNKIADAFRQIAEDQGVRFNFNAAVESFEYTAKSVSSLKVNGQLIETDGVVAGADYHHVDRHILDPQYSNYSESYWDKRKMAPSSLLMFIGLDKKLEGIKHHNLFFDADFKRHADEIYTKPQWPSDPLFYICAPSKTDDSVAPAGFENLFVLIPLAPDLDDSNDAILENYCKVIIDRIEAFTGTTISDNIIVKKFFSVKDFKAAYNSYKGNAYGLANTLDQTAVLKPSIRNNKLKNLYYTGQLTVPGPGLPPSIISGQLVGREIARKYGQYA